MSLSNIHIGINALSPIGLVAQWPVEAYHLSFNHLTGQEEIRIKFVFGTIVTMPTIAPWLHQQPVGKPIRLDTMLPAMLEFCREIVVSHKYTPIFMMGGPKHGEVIQDTDMSMITVAPPIGMVMGGGPPKHTDSFETSIYKKVAVAITRSKGYFGLSGTLALGGLTDYKYMTEVFKARVFVHSSVPEEATMGMFNDCMDEFPWMAFMKPYVAFHEWGAVPAIKEHE